MNLKEIKEKAREKKVPIMMDDGMDFVCDYIREHKQIHMILEIGTAVGYSAMKMAEIRDDIQVDTLEIDEQRYQEAIENIRSNHMEKQIMVHLCDAVLFHTAARYDLIFVDAAKAQYQKYTEHFLDNAGIGTVFLYDNLKFHGIVDDPSLSHNRSTLSMTRKIRKFREWLLSSPQFDVEYHPTIGDGVAVAVKIR